MINVITICSNRKLFSHFRPLKLGKQQGLRIYHNKKYIRLENNDFFDVTLTKTESALVGLAIWYP